MISLVRETLSRVLIRRVEFCSWIGENQRKQTKIQQDRGGRAPLDEGQADEGREIRTSQRTVDEGRVRGSRTTQEK